MKSVPRSCFGLALLLVWPTSAPAQTTFSFGGGLNVARSLPTEVPVIHGSTTQGFAVQASVGRPHRGRFAWRIDAFVSQFQLDQPSGFAGVMCAQNPPPGTCCGVCPRERTQGRVGVVGVGVNQLVHVTPAAFPLGMYLIWGAETDYLYQNPSTRGDVRVGASVGGGLTLPLGGHLHAFVEARYHHLFTTSAPTSLVPVTVGLRM